MTLGIQKSLAIVRSDEICRPEPVEQYRTRELLICAEGIPHLEQFVSRLSDQYRVLRATCEEELLDRVAQREFDLTIVDGRFYDRPLLDQLLMHQQPRSILFLAGEEQLNSLADAVACQHEIRVFATTDNAEDLVAYTEQVMFPRAENRHRIEEMFLDVSLPDGRSCTLAIADLSNHGCAIYLHSDEAAYVRCAPGARWTSARIVCRGTVVMDQVDAAIRYVEAKETQDARVGLEFIRRNPSPKTDGEPEDRIDDPVQVFALIREGLTKKNRSGILEVVETERQAGVVCSHLAFDVHQLRLMVVDPIDCQQGDVVRVSFELGGARYAFLSSVIAAIPSPLENELLVKLPRRLVRSRRRAHHRLKPASGRVAASVFSPFGTGEVRTNILDLTSSGVSFRINGSEDLFPVGTLIEPLILTFAEGDELALVGRVRSLSELPDGSWKCGVEFKNISENTAITLADKIVEATRPKVTDGIGTSFDDLWGLMKESGFVYPEKRRLLDKEAVSKTFTRLLAETNPVLKTLVSRQDGELTGHLSAVRAYSKTWEIQHLATKSTGSAMVLGRHLYMAMVEYLDQRDDSVWIRSLFQPANRWANQIFGRYERRFTDPGRKEAVTYDYVAYDNRRGPMIADDCGVKIRSLTSSDLSSVEQLFLTTGRAISLQAMDLSREELSLTSVGHVYEALSLERRREAIVAEDCSGRVRGFAFLEFSSPGLNLSEVTNSFSPYVLDPSDSDVIKALGRVAQRRYSELGYGFTIGLVEPSVTSALETLGYSRLRSYLCITAHRDLYRRLHDYLAGRFR